VTVRSDLYPRLPSRCWPQSIDLPRGSRFFALLATSSSSAPWTSGSFFTVLVLHSRSPFSYPALSWPPYVSLRHPTALQLALVVDVLAPFLAGFIQPSSCGELWATSVMMTRALAYWSRARSCPSRKKANRSYCFRDSKQAEKIWQRARKDATKMPFLYIRCLSTSYLEKHLIVALKRAEEIVDNIRLLVELLELLRSQLTLFYLDNRSKKSKKAS